jgi:polyhydroxyalkanoate synthesis regulator protein
MVNVIRSYGSNVQASVSGHLEQSLKQFLNQHQARDRPKPFGAADPPRPRPSDEAFKALSAVRIRDNDKERDDSNLTK